MKVLFHKENFKSWILFVVSFIIAIGVVSNLPDQIPIHFGPTGEADGYATRWTIFLFPAITLAMLLTAEVTKRVDPKKESYQIFGKQYYYTYFFVSIVMLVVELYVIAVSFHIEVVNISLIMPVMIGILFAVMGNMMPKFRHNYFVGIKTSWTLANEDVWFQTHRFAGKLWFVLGLIIIVSVFLPVYVRIAAVLICLVIMVVAPIVYSYLEYRKNNI